MFYVPLEYARKRLGEYPVAIFEMTFAHFPTLSHDIYVHVRYVWCA